MTGLLNDPVIQYGFAGFAIVLLGMLTWIIRESFRASRDTRDELVQVVKDSNQVVTANTQAIQNLCAGSKREIDLIDDMREKLLARPCMMDRRPPTPNP